MVVCAGMSYQEQEREDLYQKYEHVSPEAVRDAWQATYDTSVAGCMHGLHCGLGPSCTARFTECAASD